MAESSIFETACPAQALEARGNGGDVWDLEKQGLEAAVADLWAGFRGEEKHEEEEDVGGDAYLTLGGVLETLGYFGAAGGVVGRVVARRGWALMRGGGGRGGGAGRSVTDSGQRVTVTRSMTDDGWRMGDSG